MAVLAECFELLYEEVAASRVYRLKKEIPADLVNEAAQQVFSDSEADKLFFVAYKDELDKFPLLKVIRSRLQSHFGAEERATSIMEEVKRENPNLIRALGLKGSAPLEA